MVENITITQFKSETPEFQKVGDGLFTGTLEEISKEITRSAWSPFEFHNNRRLVDQFKQTSFLALDIDYGCSLAEAKEKFKNYSHIIATTRNHQKVKDDKPACDRFRVLLLIDKVITSPQEYKRYWMAAKCKWGFIDAAAKDIARFYFPSVEIISCQDNGFHFMPKKQAPKNYNTRTLAFLISGNGNPWHDELISATSDIGKQGHSLEEVIEILQQPARLQEGELSEKDIFHIRDAYKRYVTENRIYRSEFLSLAEMTKAARNDRNRKQFARQHKFPFISPTFAGKFDISSDLILIGAQTNHGKSTTAAAIAAEFIRTNRTGLSKILFLTNEEDTDSVASRIAFILIKEPFIDATKYEIVPEDHPGYEDAYNEVFTRLIIISPNCDRLNMSKLEDVIEMMDKAAEESNIALVIMDYLQTITQSAVYKNSLEISKAFGLYLKKFYLTNTTPVVVFAQLKDSGGGEGFSSRIQNDSWFLNHVTVGIEIKANKADKRTKFIFHKSRFSNIEPVTLDFSKGYFV